jgi:hypothetical protein
MTTKKRMIRMQRGSTKKMRDVRHLETEGTAAEEETNADVVAVTVS